MQAGDIKSKPAAAAASEPDPTAVAAAAASNRPFFAVIVRSHGQLYQLVDGAKDSFSLSTSCKVQTDDIVRVQVVVGSYQQCGNALHPEVELLGLVVRPHKQPATRQQTTKAATAAAASPVCICAHNTRLHAQNPGNERTAYVC